MSKPIVTADGLVLVVFPVQILLWFLLVGRAQQSWQKRYAVGVEFNFRSGNLGRSWQKIPEGPDVVVHLVRGNFPRPAGNGGNTEGTVIAVTLAPARGAITLKVVTNRHNGLVAVVPVRAVTVI